MESNTILDSDVLDIIFDGRNKQYGAYQLRKSYNRRLGIALAVMFSVCLLAIVGKVLAGNDVKHKAKQPIMTEFTLDDVREKPVVPPPPPPTQDPPKVEVIKDFPPVLVDEPTPPLATQEEMNNAVLGSFDQHGLKGLDYVAPPVETITTGTKKELVHEEDYELGMPVQIQAQFPGGADAWRKFLERNLKQDIATDNGAPTGDYQVVISFLVDRSGNVTEVKAENDPGYGVAAEAIRVIQRSGKWTPAIQNGRNVIYRQRQAVIFRVTDQ